MSSETKRSNSKTTANIAIVCDWLSGGGAERVVKAMHELYPDAPIYTSYVSPSQRSVFNDATIYASGFLSSRLGGVLRKFLPSLRERYFEKLDLSDYDTVISASGAEAKGIRVPDQTLHINYCHSPTHYYWVRYDEYLANPGFGILNPLARLGLRLTIKRRRKWDLTAAQRPDVIIANSTITQARIKQFYDRDAEIIFPPVDIERFVLNNENQRTGFVTAGRQTPYKRFDLAVLACTKLNLPLTVIGDGPEHPQLAAIAGPTIKFLTNVSDEEMVQHFQTAQAFIFPGVEDFGITPVEAMACGTPVIAYKEGGSTDTVAPGLSGEFFDEQTPESLIQALKKFDATSYDVAKLRNHAEQFSTRHFKEALSKLVSRYQK